VGVSSAAQTYFSKEPKPYYLAKIHISGCSKLRAIQSGKKPVGVKNREM
jgi:hypothetical protein